MSYPHGTSCPSSPTGFYGWKVHYWNERTAVHAWVRSPELYLATEFTTKVSIKNIHKWMFYKTVTSPYTTPLSTYLTWVTNYTEVYQYLLMFQCQVSLYPVYPHTSTFQWQYGTVWVNSSPSCHSWARTHTDWEAKEWVHLLTKLVLVKLSDRPLRMGILLGKKKIGVVTNKRLTTDVIGLPTELTGIAQQFFFEKKNFISPQELKNLTL